MSGSGSRIALFAIAGLMAAVGLGYLVESAVGEKVALQGASEDVNFKLSPDGAAGKRAMQGGSQADPTQIEVGPDGKVIKGSGSIGDPGYHTNNAGAAGWDD